MILKCFLEFLLHNRNLMMFDGIFRSTKIKLNYSIHLKSSIFFYKNCIDGEMVKYFKLCLP